MADLDRVVEDLAARLGRAQSIHHPQPDGHPPALSGGEVCAEDGQRWPCRTELAIRPQKEIGG